MYWILLGILAIALIVLSSQYPKLAFGLFFSLFLAGGAFYWMSLNNADFRISRIEPTDIALLDPSMRPGYAGSFNFHGRLLNNNASATLAAATVHINFLDCHTSTENEAGNGNASIEIESEPECVVIGERSERVELPVPPGQARDFNRNVSFDRAKSSGSPSWQYQITNVRAQ